MSAACISYLQCLSALPRSQTQLLSKSASLRGFFLNHFLADAPAHMARLVRGSLWLGGSLSGVRGGYLVDIFQGSCTLPSGRSKSLCSCASRIPSHPMPAMAQFQMISEGSLHSLVDPTPFVGLEAVAGE